MKTIGHKMILASAGSGKTFALTNRFVKLLASGAEPERIVALTFTRKAAGEFFDEILRKLAQASVDEMKARKLASDIDQPELRPADFLRMLRQVVDSIHRLRLGTFDGFFARIARNFPIELGLTGEFEILQEHTSRRERGRVLQRMFQRAGGLTEAQKEFIEAFKRATFGAEEKRLGIQLDLFLDQHQEIFLAAPDLERWGRVEQIWPEGMDWTHGEIAHEAVATLRAWVERVPWKDAPRQRWHEFLAEIIEWVPGLELKTPLSYILGKSLESWPELLAGKATLNVLRQKLELDAEASGALVTLVRQVVGGEIMRRLEITRGIHAVLAGYESVYHDSVRRAGKLTFGDVQRLLMPENAGDRLLSRKTAEDGRLFIDYRLDAEIDHWLLDEFQDTSFGQWSVLKNLVDEAVQDVSGARSFFYVGDIKQAIFAWREGDPRLFREIFDHYNSAQTGLIAEEHLLESYRSGPSIVSTVNEVFGNAAVMAELFGSGAETWNREWKEHRTAQPQLDGQVALLHADSEEERFRVTLDLLMEIDPLARGLSCAVLVQKNSTASELADYLRREGGLEAIAESNLRICTDNPVGSALLALFKVAAFPGDVLAREQVAMTPLAAVLERQDLLAADKLTMKVITQIEAGGFELTAGYWLEQLETTWDSGDRFTRLRCRQFTAAAGLFDATGSRDIAEFIEFMECHVVREAESDSAIRVMTVHKSKGLGFDVVILPDLEGKKLGMRREGLAVQRGKDRSIEWVMDLPGKDFIERDPVLGEFIRSAEGEAAYENLSLLYVAMTRAKRAMYLIIKPPGKSTSHNFPKLLSETLGESLTSIRIGRREFVGAYASGNPDWFSLLNVPAKAPAVASHAVRIELGNRRPSRLLARRPSETSLGSLSGGRLFALSDSSDAIELGLAVHGLLAEVEWVAPGTLDQLEVTWENRAGRALALDLLRAANFESIWRPKARHQIWRERTFEIVLNGVWITGIFDRVEVALDESGRAISATVFDFKLVHDETGIDDRYVAQLNLYRAAAAQLTGLPVGSVACELVLVRQLRRILVSPNGI